jgi:plasmid stability protein
MRTTVELPEPLFRELKATAARRGTSLKNIIRAAIEQELHGKDRRPARRLKFPLATSRQPGVLNPTNADIEAFLA